MFLHLFIGHKLNNKSFIFSAQHWFSLIQKFSFDRFIWRREFHLQSIVSVTVIWGKSWSTINWIPGKWIVIGSSRVYLSFITDWIITQLIREFTQVFNESLTLTVLFLPLIEFVVRFIVLEFFEKSLVFIFDIDSTLFSHTVI